MRIKLEIEYDAIRGRTYQAVMNGIQYTEDGLQFQKFMDEIDEIDRELNNIEQEEDSQEIIRIFKEHNIDIDTAPDLVQVLASHPEENVRKIASTVSEMVKNGDIINPVGFLRKDKEWKIKQILEGKIKPNKKTTSKKKWLSEEYEIYNPHIN